jgi:hypothetical protein
MDQWIYVVGRAWVCQLDDLECCLGSHTLKWPVGVVFIATNQNLAIGEVCWWRVHRTVRCATGQCPVRRHVIVSLGLGAGRPLEALSSCGTGQSGAPPDSPVPLWLLLWHSEIHCSLCRVDRCAQIAVASLAHRTLSGATPDSPVNYSGGAPGKPEGEEFELVHPVHRTLSGGTPDCTLRQTRAHFSFLFAPFFWSLTCSFDWFVLNLWHLYNVWSRAN